VPSAIGTGGVERRAGMGGGAVGGRLVPLASGVEGARGRKDSKGVGGLGSVARSGGWVGAGGCEGRVAGGSSAGVVRARL
jgi:hypothetical protein